MIGADVASEKITSTVSKLIRKLSVVRNVSPIAAQATQNASFVMIGTAMQPITAATVRAPILAHFGLRDSAADTGINTVSR